MFEACANGVTVAGKTAGVVIMNYIAFMAMLSFLNATLSWLGERVGNPELSFEVRVCFRSNVDFCSRHTRYFNILFLSVSGHLLLFILAHCTHNRC